MVYFFLFYEPDEFRGYQKCITTALTQLQRKTFLCRGEAYGKCPELHGANTELSIMTPLKYVGSRENQTASILR